MVSFYGKVWLAPLPIPNLEDHTLSAVCDCLCSIFNSYFPYWKSFLHSQPKDAPRRDDRDPLITAMLFLYINKPRFVPPKLMYIFTFLFSAINLYIYMHSKEIHNVVSLTVN